METLQERIEGFGGDIDIADVTQKGSYPKVSPSRKPKFPLTFSDGKEFPLNFDKNEYPLTYEDYGGDIDSGND
jgi:hypothetical protein